MLWGVSLVQREECFQLEPSIVMLGQCVRSAAGWKLKDMLNLLPPTASKCPKWASLSFALLSLMNLSACSRRVLLLTRLVLSLIAMQLATGRFSGSCGIQVFA